MWIEGELSNVATPGSGHWYFSLKDDRAQIRCAFFRGKNIRCRVRPAHGQKVLVQGRVSLYEGRGDYQLIVEQMEDAGVGALQRAFEALKAKLQREGLFDVASKKTLPKMPNHVGIITSSGGAAVHDMIKVFGERCPMIPITIIPALVQGQEAPQSIIDAIELAEASNQFDVLIVGRGGGSLEDLWAFNDERLARRIAVSRIPIVSAVGHESDVSISDLVADARAATPSQAAEILSPDQSMWLRQTKQYADRLTRHQHQRILNLKATLSHLSRRLRHPSQKLNEQAQQLDQFELRLKAAINTQLSTWAKKTQLIDQRIAACNPQLSIARRKQLLERYSQRILAINNRALQQRRLQLATAAAKLNTVSPLATLDRGYAMTFDSKGCVVSSADSLNHGEKVTIKWSNGERSARIEDDIKEQPKLL